MCVLREMNKTPYMQFISKKNWMSIKESDKY